MLSMNWFDLRVEKYRELEVVNYVHKRMVVQVYVVCYDPERKF